MKLLLTSICLLAALVVSGQSDTLHWRKGVKLSWDDFKGATPGHKQNSWNLSQWKTSYSIDGSDVLSPRMQVVVYVNRATSWVNDEAKTEENLERNLNRFNLFELGARKSRMKLDSIRVSGDTYTRDEADDIIRKCFDWYDLQNSRMSDDYYYQSRSDYRSYWTTRIDSFFQIWDTYNKYVLIDKSKVGYDYDFTMGLGNWTNHNENLTKAFGFNASFQLGLMQNAWLYGTRLSLTNNVATPEFRQRMGFGLDEPDQFTSAELMLYIGHNIINKPTFRTFFTLNGGRSSISGNNNFVLGSWSYTTSLVTDIVLNRDKKGYEMSNNRYTNFCMRLRFDYNVASYNDFYKPRILLLTIGFSVNGYSPRYARAGSIRPSGLK